MYRATVMLDTNVVIDYLSRREPFFERARLVMLCGRAGEFRLLLAASQITDLVYILSNGGRASEVPAVQQRLRGLRTFVDVVPVDAAAIDRMLSTGWNDPEHALLYDLALAAGADCLLTRNKADFKAGPLPVMDCDEFFAWVEETRGALYDEISIAAP